MSQNWTEAELLASVDAYIEMRALESKGHPFRKKDFYVELASQFGRSAGAYEYRMQNISYVYSLQGRQWVTGLKPARNVGTNVIKTLERLIAEREGQELGGIAGFGAKLIQHKKLIQDEPPKGKTKPATILSAVTQFDRDPAVVAWVLNKADGICECCESPAPFVREDGSPFLEVHHVQRLVDGGADTVENAVALCPNCHRELHYGLNKQELEKTLREKVQRLK